MVSFAAAELHSIRRMGLPEYGENDAYHDRSYEFDPPASTFAVEALKTVDVSRTETKHWS